MTMVRTLEELLNLEEPGLSLVRDWMGDATNEVEMLPCEAPAGERTLYDLQVTTRSPMGAIAHGTGGLLVDGGWVRVLGAGCPRLGRSITEWNAMHEGRATRLEHALLVGDDVVGGFFAISGGGIPVPPGNVGYYAPDLLEWEDTEVGYSDWLWWLFTGDLERYYENVRWPGWRDEVRDVPGDRGVSIAPFPCFEGPPITERSRRVVPLEELWGLYVDDLPKQLQQPSADG